jgi:hypothetical protein
MDELNVKQEKYEKKIEVANILQRMIDRQKSDPRYIEEKERKTFEENLIKSHKLMKQELQTCLRLCDFN